MNKYFRVAAALALMASIFTMTFSASAYHEGGDDYHPIANEEFQEVWERTDYPVERTVVDRTWIWGPAGFSDLIVEEYDDAEGGEREVQYFDKSRMEMPRNGEVDEDSPWFITQGRLAYELMTGNLQLGDQEEDFEQHQPSYRSVAGDPDDDTAPTYAAMGNLMDEGAREEGEVISAFANHEGNVTTDENLADYGVTAEYYVSETDHTIASVFWDFMNSETTIYNEDGEFVTAQLFQENGFYAIGFPTTEAYWAWAEVDNVHQHVLVQCFERRCLTYTPGNPEGWQVESGNIGQHYYNWRYNVIDRENPQEPEEPQTAAGTFTYNGESSATIDVGEEITLTANAVSGDDQPVEDAPVYFHILEDGENVVSLNPDHARTDAQGNAQVAVTGETEGTARVHAFVDMNDNQSYDLETDIGLGNVEVTVGEVDDGVTPETGSFTFEGESEAEVNVDSDITLTAAVEDAEGQAVANAEVFFWSEGDDEPDPVISLDPLSIETGADGTAEVTVTGVAEGTADVHAFADLNDNGVYDDGTDIDLGVVAVTVTANGAV